MQNKESPPTAIDRGVPVILIAEDLKTTPEFSPSSNTDKNEIDDDVKKSSTWWVGTLPTISHYLVLTTLGLLTWGFLWCTWGNEWSWNGPWFRLAFVAFIAWASGEALQRLTTLPPLLAALLTGILARNLGYLNMQHFTHIDVFLRKIFAVVILGKGSLAWDVNFIKQHWRQILPLGVVPWAMEVTTLAICMHLLFGHPWIWGFLLGTLYASVTCAVVMPAVVRAGSNPARKRNWTQLVCTAGGTDTALSVGVYGIIYSFMFSKENDIYRYVKAAATLLVGVVLGVTWGSLAKLLPHSRDYYVTELRILFVLVGGLFANFFTMRFGWGGVAGVAVLACNATAATHWARDGWKLNNNPASTAYRVLWAVCEPTLFAYTGTFYVIKSSLWETVLMGLGILLICLIVRLSAAALLCWKMTLKEKLFICSIWMPKTIVESVLCPLALNTLIIQGNASNQEMQYAQDQIYITVEAIAITTPIAFLLTKYLAPKLIKDKQKDDPGL